MPSLLELFRNLPLSKQGGKTASEVYAIQSTDDSPLVDVFRNEPLPKQNNKTADEVFAIRNSKDIRINSTNAILNATIFPLVQKTLRSNKVFTNKMRETFFESELVGLRALRALSSPVLYGTDIFRLKRRSTNILDVMKNASAGSDGTAFISPNRGVVGNLINKAKDAGLQIAAKLGIAFPETLIPTRITLNRFFVKGKEPDTMTTLAEIQNDGAGNLIGQFLAKNAKGTPNQIGNQVIGAGIDVLKSKVRKKLFGSPLAAGQNLAFKTPNQVQYDSVDRYSKTVLGTSETISSRNDLSSILTEKINLLNTLKENPDGGQKLLAAAGGSPGIPPAAGVSPLILVSRETAGIGSQAELDEVLQGRDRLKSKLAARKSKVAESAAFGNANDVETKEIQSNLAQGRKKGQKELAKTKNFNNPAFLYENKIKYSSTVDAKNTEIFSRNDASTRLALINKITFVLGTRPATEPNYQSRIYETLYGEEQKEEETLPTPRTALANPEGLPGLEQFPPSKFSQIVNKSQSELGGARFKEQAELAAFREGKNTNFQYNSTVPYGKTVDVTQEDISLRNDMSTKLEAIDKAISELGTNALPIIYKIGRIKSAPYSFRNTRISQNSLEAAKLGIQKGSDKLNIRPIYYTQDGNPPEGAVGGTLSAEDGDLIPLRFSSIVLQAGVDFRATITGLTETISPSWNASKFIGNPYNFYTYEGVERSVSFTFKIYALNGNELKMMWEKLDFLNTFAYPQKFASPYVTPPFMRITLGNMYKNKEGFVDSLSFTIDDNTPWEIGTDGKYFGHISSYGLTDNTNRDVLDKEDISPIDLKDYKLPTIVEVQMTIKFIESQSTFWNNNGNRKIVYYYGEGDRAAMSNLSGKNTSGLDGKPFSTSNVDRNVLSEQQRAQFETTVSSLNAGVSTTLAQNASTNLTPNATRPTVTRNNIGGTFSSQGSLSEQFRAGSAGRRANVFGNGNIFNK